MIDQRIAERGIHDPFGQRHPHRVGGALPERTGRGLDAVGMAVFRMARCLAVDLAKPLDLLDRHILVAGEIQQRIQQHGAMTVRDQEPVAVQPVRVRRIEPQEFGEQHGRDVRHPHRHPGMAALGMFDRVHRQGADAVGEFPQMRVPRTRQGVRKGLNVVRHDEKSLQRARNREFERRVNRRLVQNAAHSVHVPVASIVSRAIGRPFGRNHRGACRARG